MFSIRTSIHGRRLALSSSGGIVSDPSGSTQGADRSAQMWGRGLFETVSGAVGAISNSGVSIVSSDSTSGSSMPVAAPVQGVEKEIVFQTSATALVLHTTATTIKFNSTLAESAAGGSTTLTVTGAAAGIGGTLVLRGLSATAWQIKSATVSVSS